MKKSFLTFLLTCVFTAPATYKCDIGPNFDGGAFSAALTAQGIVGESTPPYPCTVAVLWATQGDGFLSLSFFTIFAKGHAASRGVFAVCDQTVQGPDLSIYGVQISSAITTAGG